MANELSALDIEMGKDKVFPTYTADIQGITRTGFIEVLQPKYQNRFYYQDCWGHFVYTYVNAPHFSNLQEVKTVPKTNTELILVTKVWKDEHFDFHFHISNIGNEESISNVKPITFKEHLIERLLTSFNEMVNDSNIPDTGAMNNGED